VSLIRRSGGKRPYIMTGGVAQNAGVVQALQDKLGETILVPGEAQLCGALGAALFALK
jgi:activator of 2-hydroxyglutaryl-CoA dehydratase